MAYLVLALGALLSVGGGLSIFYGAGIVEVERGWTGVIAGATSLTGGILTIALGLILRTLLDLRAATSSVAAANAQHVPEPAFPALPPTAPAVPAAAPIEADLEGDLLAAFLSPQPHEAEAGLPPAHAAAETAVSARSHPAIVPEPLVQAEEPGEAAPVRSRFRIGFKGSAVEPAEPMPVAAIAEQPVVPAMDDWLDRAFSSLDSELGSGLEEPAHRGGVTPSAPTHEEAHSEAHPDALAGHDIAELDRANPRDSLPLEAAAPLVPQTEVASPEPAAHPPAMPATYPTAAPPSQSAVIGRYEADGTSYVMFADGSIEAQSEAGVYRFTSMTELKAFIEGTG